MLPQFTQLCAAQRTGHATQSRPSVWPRGCLRKAWQRVLASSAAMPSARASEERGHNHFWNCVSPKFFFFTVFGEKEKRRAAGARPEAGEKEEGKGKEEEGRRRVYELCTVV